MLSIVPSLNRPLSNKAVGILGKRKIPPSISLIWLLLHHPVKI